MLRHVKTKVSKKKLYRLTRLVFYISLFHSNMLQETFLLYCPLSLFHPTSLMFGRESFGWWRSESWSPSPPPIDSISTDRLDLHCALQRPLLPLQKETPAQLDEKRLSGSGILRGLLPCLCYIFCVTIYQPSKSVTKTMKIKNKKRKVKKL